MSDEQLRTDPVAAGPTLSLGETLSGIFFEPGRVFESFRARPRFLVAALISLVALMAFQLLFIQRLGFENIVRSRIESSAPEMEPAQREQLIVAQSGTIAKVITVVAPVVVFAIIFAAGAGLYLLGTLAMGKSITYKQALAVWSYSSLPPGVLITLGNLIMLLIRSPEDIDIPTASRGLVRANLGILVDGAASPVLATVLGAFDLFQIFGLILAALGLRKVGRLSSGAAWAVVLGIYLLGVVIKIAFAALLKTPMA